MLLVTDGRVRPDFAGNLYCHMMSACHELRDVRRARAWTEATGRWLDALPGAVIFTGVCRVHRSQVHQLGGAWDRAEAEAMRVTRDLARLNVATAAEAHYQVGELRRLRGDHAGAEAAYRRAHERGRDPQPGLALLRLAQGRVDAAVASIRVALAAASQPLERTPLLAAQVRIAALAADAAPRGRGRRGAAGDRRPLGQRRAPRRGRARRGHRRPRRRPSRGGPRPLRDALRRWLELDAPYEAAGVRCDLAGAVEALGDRRPRSGNGPRRRRRSRRSAAVPDLEALRRARRAGG